MKDYMDDDGILRCSNCGMPAHKSDCNKAVARHFKRYMTRVHVEDGRFHRPVNKHTGRI